MGGCRKGQLGAVVEVYVTPFEAYDVEIVAADGRTEVVLESMRPEQFEVVTSAGGHRSVAPIRDAIS